MQVQRFAACFDGDTGGNPAGVLIARQLPDASEMQGLAAEAGFSETAFAAPWGIAGVCVTFHPKRKSPLVVMQPSHGVLP